MDFYQLVLSQNPSLPAIRDELNIANSSLNILKEKSRGTDNILWAIHEIRLNRYIFPARLPATLFGIETSHTCNEKTYWSSQTKRTVGWKTGQGLKLGGNAFTSRR